MLRWAIYIVVANYSASLAIIVPEPAPKRKTLVERAGEVSTATAVNGRHVAGASTGSATGHYRNGPLVSSGAATTSTSRLPSTLSSSTSSRNTSTSSFSNSVSSSQRPTTAYSHYRPQTAMAQHARYKSQNSLMGPYGARPASSMDSRRVAASIDDGRAGASTSAVNEKQKPNGMIKTFSLSSNPSQKKYSYVLAGQRQQCGPVASFRDQSFASVWSGSVVADSASTQKSSISHNSLDGEGSSRRVSSLSAALERLTIKSDVGDHATSQSLVVLPDASSPSSFLPKNSSFIPKLIPKTPQTPTSATDTLLHSHVKSRNLHRTPQRNVFLTKDSNTKVPAWDADERLENMNGLLNKFMENVNNSMSTGQKLDEIESIYKSRSMSNAEICTTLARYLSVPKETPYIITKWINTLTHAVTELESAHKQLSTSNDTLSSELNDVRERLATTRLDLESEQRTHSIEVDDLKRKYRNDTDDLQENHRRESELLRRNAQAESDRLKRESQDEADRLQKDHREEVLSLERNLRAEIDAERSLRVKESQEASTKISLERQNIELDLEKRNREARDARSELDQTKAMLEQEKALNASLRNQLAEASSAALSLEASMKAMKAKIDFLESDNQAQSQAFADLNQKMQDAFADAEAAQEKLRQEETLRRKLHNQVQELKGNIRVFCRVRPALGAEEEPAKIKFPDVETDSKEVVVQGPEHKTTLGNVTSTANAFSFDRVFGPNSVNSEVFNEISQLVQSALDGYNVCIFCYGQTGSGKTHTMSSLDGMIPRAVHQIYDTARTLEEKGWTYRMEGSFVEVYNENLNDLLGKAEELDKKKHEIRHDSVRCKTTITDVATVVLDSPARVESILKRASTNRSVAATKANERSSRSHSVFILRLTGENSITGEKSEGTLNLVDLAGSERLSHSGAKGERLKETQNINRSLSCLGDVIGALGQGKEGGHIPYRNSKVSLGMGLSSILQLPFVKINARQCHRKLTHAART